VTRVACQLFKTCCFPWGFSVGVCFAFFVIFSKLCFFQVHACKLLRFPSSSPSWLIIQLFLRILCFGSTLIMERFSLFCRLCLIVFARDRHLSWRSSAGEKHKLAPFSWKKFSSKKIFWKKGSETRLFYPSNICCPVYSCLILVAFFWVAPYFYAS